MTPSSYSLAHPILVWSILYHATKSLSVFISVIHLSSSSLYIIPIPPDFTFDTYLLFLNLRYYPTGIIRLSTSMSLILVSTKNS